MIPSVEPGRVIRQGLPARPGGGRPITAGIFALRIESRQTSGPLMPMLDTSIAGRGRWILEMRASGVRYASEPPAQGVEAEVSASDLLETHRPTSPS